MGELSLKKKEIAGEKTQDERQHTRNKRSQSRLRHGRCQRAGKPRGWSRVDVFGLKEKGL